MEVKLMCEYGPDAMVEKMVFQFVRSVESPGGNVAENNCGSESPDNKFPDVVGDCRRPLARFCKAVGRELMNWVISLPMLDAPEVPACAAAADCCAVPAVLVVGGGSVNGVSTEALLADPAWLDM